MEYTSGAKIIAKWCIITSLFIEYNHTNLTQTRIFSEDQARVEIPKILQILVNVTWSSIFSDRIQLSRDQFSEILAGFFYRTLVILFFWTL